MKIRNQAVLLALAAFGLVSCSDDNPWAGQHGQGGIDLKLSASADVKDALPQVRAVPDFEAPDASLFAISLLDNETGYEQKWDSLEEFQSESGFNVGEYTLTAYYGNVHDNGFEKPCFIGKADVSVHEGRESEVEVTATLANSMVSVEYSDAFKNYFRDYRSIASTDGDVDVTFAKNETRPGFLTPGNISLLVTVTHPSGKTLTLNAGRFTALARHHYHMTYDVSSDPTGTAVLQVIFDDSLDKEIVTISMSDELVNSPVPVISPVGFTPGNPIEALAGNPAPDNLKFRAQCLAGISECTLTIAGSNYTPSFGNMVDLLNADANTQQQLKESGISVAGLYKESIDPSEWISIDVTNLPKSLPEGTFTVTLNITDKLGRAAEPVSLQLQTSKVSLEVVEEKCFANYSFRDKTSSSSDKGVPATVEVSYNGFQPESIKFENWCQNRAYKSSKVVKVEESTRTRNLETKNYIYTLELCDVETNPLPMKLLYGNIVIDFQLIVNEPEYSVEVDAFNDRALFKVNPSEVAQLENIVNGLYLYNVDSDGKVLSAPPSANLTRNITTGIVTMSYLQPDTEYAIGYSVTDCKVGSQLADNQVLKFRTEVELQIPNNDFSQTSRLNIQGLDCGGQYLGWPLTYQNKSSIDRLVPTEWATINPKTANPNASNKNTWFIVPSTFVEDGQAILRNVGYSTNGTTPERTGGAAGTTTNYNTGAPTFADSEKVAGELFLGSYTFDNTAGASRINGIAFASRPKSLTFDYKYVPQDNDTGTVYVALLDNTGNKIFEQSKDLAKKDTMGKVTFNFPVYKFGQKVARLRLEFKSSKNIVAPIKIPTGSELNEGFGAVGNHNIGANKYHAVATGSILYIDNVQLNY